MKQCRIYVFIITMLFFGCDILEDDKEAPIVLITYPADGSIVSEIVTITCMATDNKGIDKVELW